jgi:hypothetical protein
MNDKTPKKKSCYDNYMDITNQSIESLLHTLADERKEAFKVIINMMTEITQRQPKLWGTIVGFGKLHYRYKTGHSGDMPILGLANRKEAITLYLSNDIEKFKQLKKLGQYKIGKACLYIKQLRDIDLHVLKDIMKTAFQEALAYPFVRLIE